MHNPSPAPSPSPSLKALRLEFKQKLNKLVRIRKKDLSYASPMPSAPHRGYARRILAWIVVKHLNPSRPSPALRLRTLHGRLSTVYALINEWERMHVLVEIRPQPLHAG
jgi:hypothetical protein